VKGILILLQCLLVLIVGSIIWDGVVKHKYRNECQTLCQSKGYLHGDVTIDPTVGFNTICTCSTTEDFVLDDKK